ncbi:DEAD/DEAH box helicase [Paracoccus fistulariae]|uniref:DEAD/DEAH box helicase n=1 Tax=Paracoccus fistulariae TaxID=658446 RepID=A0ABY7SIV8_9RHOB|nr:DEAD/DEAH box helicase [Paracoccus fistulariae]MDB6180834.1 DEAD/DEAH box helicase [Paracoccus fistulariae]WCR06947.1 DEAD/DEAH box helicase [Paracoccus fistulariae]
MTHDKIAAPLAAALADKGYDSLTAVQEAVLADGLEGRDMLVSAQTGSGKTVAFGLAIAPDLLDASQALPPAQEPIGLAIAPTRELALQVARELGWLYGKAGAQVVTCVGGMDFRAEKRALDRGAHIVVGTPGRLRDHIERGSLDMSWLQVAVLDEADEMLDLGFREDLEFILQSAPKDRRTLMFSATVPPEIESLAKDFQRDAQRIVAKGEARQHGDIEYRALNVAARDREPAIFNLLRFYEARTAIIFCKTRANVTHLLARMSNRGFRAVALSGELSQQERTHALQSLRDGRAQICVATDVAARGIDLPGLDLVIHADLPTNSETLLHRSGRTGRAGSKGVSAMIVMPSERKKAHSLLRRAKLDAEWGAPPSADEVLARDNERMLESPVFEADPGDDAELAADLLHRFGPERLAAALIQLWREGRPAPEELTVLQDRPPSEPRQRPEFGDSVWFHLSVGYSGRAEPRWLLPKICDAGGINRDAIGAIRVKTDDSFVQVDAKMAERFGAMTELEPGLEMTRLAEAPDLDAPRGNKPGPRPARGPRSRDERPSAPRPPRKDFGDRTDGKPAKSWDKPARVAKPSEAAFHDAPPADGDKPRKKPRWTAEDKAKRKPRAAVLSADDRPRRKFAKGGKPGFAAGKPRGAKSGKPPRKGK